jgi:YacP-like NYN domain
MSLDRSANMRPLYLVDGFNFLHAVLLKGRERAEWWGPENQLRVLEALAPLAARVEPLELWVVFDRRPASGEPRSGVTPDPVLHAGIEVHRAADADDYIVARCADLACRREVVVVSADRSLCDRARRQGASGLSPWAFAGYLAPGSASGAAGTR